MENENKTLATQEAAEKAFDKAFFTHEVALAIFRKAPETPATLAVYRKAKAVYMEAREVYGRTDPPYLY